MELVNRRVWKEVITDYETPKYLINQELVETPYDLWSHEERLRADYNAKASNIIFSALNYDEFFRISTCSTAKEAWDLIQVTHEGTNDVRRARMNALMQEGSSIK